MATYTLNIIIDDAMLAAGSSDSLCIAKKVNGSYNVIFQGASPVPKPDQKLLVTNNTFEWEDDYQVFLTTSFGNGVFIHASTNTVPIKFGELVQFEKGVLQDAVGADTSTWDSQSGATSTFAVDGGPVQFHTAVQQSTGGGSFSTIYVDPHVHMGVSRIELTPINKYLLFWKEIQTTEAMLAISTGAGHEWSFPTGKTEKTIRFGYAKPNQPSSATEAPGWYDQKSS